MSWWRSKLAEPRACKRSSIVGCTNDECRLAMLSHPGCEDKIRGIASALAFAWSTALNVAEGRARRRAPWQPSFVRQRALCLTVGLLLLVMMAYFSAKLSCNRLLLFVV